jgi:hypothetical protein
LSLTAEAILSVVSQQKLMEAGNRANNSGVKPIQEAATLPVKLQYFFMKSETAQVKTATYNS